MTVQFIVPNKKLIVKVVVIAPLRQKRVAKRFDGWNC